MAHHGGGPVRELSHYQFSWSADLPGQFTLELVLDQGADAALLELQPDAADVLQELLRHSSRVSYDIDRRVLLFGTTSVGG